jgi:hypothetical protein
LYLYADGPADDRKMANGYLTVHLEEEQNIVGIVFVNTGLHGDIGVHLKAKLTLVLVQGKELQGGSA